AGAVYYILGHDVSDPIEQIRTIEKIDFRQPKFVPKPITLEQVFNQDKIDVPKSAMTILFTGDVMLARKVNAKATQYGNFTWPFEKVADRLSASDITVVNLEGPITKNCPLTTEGFKFCGDKRHITGLTLAGVDIANLANNHSDNYGQVGLKETKEILGSDNIRTFGVGEPLFYTHKSTSLAFLGYDVVFQESDPLMPAIEADIARAADRADLVIVSFHWGDEYTDTPNKHQTSLAHAAIDAGADVIIGHHPHWIQTVEIYNDKLIQYSLGNFVFDQMWSQKTREGIAAELSFYENKLVDAELLPVLIEDFGQPRFLDGVEKTKIIREIKSNSTTKQ
ncbi:CapA family protein, partial [Patescibacteria group bacterium]